MHPQTYKAVRRLLSKLISMEFLVAVAVIAILAGMLIPAICTARQRALEIKEQQQTECHHRCVVHCPKGSKE